jgi:hypothetical protein
MPSTLPSSVIDNYDINDMKEMKRNGSRIDEAIEAILQASPLDQPGSYAIHGQLDSFSLPGLHVDGIEDDISFPLPKVIANVWNDPLVPLHIKFSFSSHVLHECVP